MGNILSIDNSGYKKVKQEYIYDDLYQLTNAKGYYSYNGKTNTYEQTFNYDDTGNITHKISVNTKTPSGQQPANLNYDYIYKYDNLKPHTAIKIGDWFYDYDKNGNLQNKFYKEKNLGYSNSNNLKHDSDNEDNSPNSGWMNRNNEESGNLHKKGNGNGHAYAYGHHKHKQTIGLVARYTWNEENRLKESRDNGKSTYFLYDKSGERTIKRGQHGETLYINKFIQIQNRDITTKHIFIGATRIVSKLSHYNDGGSDLNYEQKNVYFYHPDHLGSTTFVSDPAGQEYEHLEYTPYGETWIEEESNPNVLGYKFTSKELDEETGLYYYGARYMDPETGRWLSTDPAMEKYLPIPPITDEAKGENQNLPGQGGIFNPVNTSVYHYSGNNPLRYSDPTGEYPKTAEEAKSYFLFNRISSIPPEAWENVIEVANYNTQSGLNYIKILNYQKAHLSKAAQTFINELGTKGHTLYACSGGSCLLRNAYSDKNLNIKNEYKTAYNFINNKDQLFSLIQDEKGRTITDPTNLSKKLEVGDLLLYSNPEYDSVQNSNVWTGHVATVIAIDKDYVTTIEYHVKNEPSIQRLRRDQLQYLSDTKLLGGAKWNK